MIFIFPGISDPSVLDLNFFTESCSKEYINHGRGEVIYLTSTANLELIQSRVINMVILEKVWSKYQKVKNDHADIIFCIG